MQITACRSLLLGSILSILGATASFSAFAADATVWEIGTRNLPAPAGVSAELRDAIIKHPVPPLARASFAPESRQQWEAFINAANAQQGPSLSDIEQRAGVTIQADQLSGVNIFRITPNEKSPDYGRQLFIYMHGGAYVFGAGSRGIGESARIAGAVGIEAIAIDYRMPPEFPFPAAVDDALAVYRAAIESYDPRSIAIGGTSAGGGLSLALVHKLKQEKLGLPGAIYAGTPWADLTKTGDSLYTNEGIDRFLVTYDGYLGAAAKLYANGQNMKDPLISPVYGDFDAFPPTILISGTRDLFLSDTVRTHRKLRAAGVEADLHVYEAMSHGGYGIVINSPESRDMFGELARFIEQHLE